MNRLIYFHLSGVLMPSGNACAPTSVWRDLRWPLRDTLQTASLVCRTTNEFLAHIADSPSVPQREGGSEGWGLCEERLALCASLRHTDEPLSARTGERRRFSVVAMPEAEKWEQRTGVVFTPSIRSDSEQSLIFNCSQKWTRQLHLRGRSGNHLHGDEERGED